MQEYFKFVWTSTIYPHGFMDMFPAFQLILLIIFLYFSIKAIISIYKHKKNGNK
jgi:uncharacterized membrane protein